MKPKKVLALVKDTMEEMLPLMKVDADVSYTYVEEESPAVNVDFVGEELGYLIGAHGTHLKAFQYIVSLMINRKIRAKDEDAARVYVNMDVGGYRQEKIDHIKGIAMHVADEVRESGEPVDMQPMSPADRRIVHMVLSEVEDITTDSQGEGRDRYVRVTVA